MLILEPPLVARLPELSDAQDMVRLRNDPGVRAGLLGFSPGVTAADMEQWATRSRADVRSLVYVLEQQGVFAGHVGLYEIDHRAASAEVGIAIAKQVQRQGVGRRVLDAFVSYAFLELRLHRVQARVLATNLASLALFRAIGFSDEGVLRDADFRRGQFVDVVVLSRLQTDA